MIVLMNTGGIAATNCYLVADETSGQAVLFDAPDHTAAPLLAEAKRRGFEVVGLWLTHGHFDHVADHAEVSKVFPGAKVLIHPLDEAKLQQPNAMLGSLLPFKIPPRRADEFIGDGQMLQLGSLEVQVIHTPGHSPGHVMYHLKAQNVLVGGDLIICGAVGRTDFPDSDPAALKASIRRVMTLPGPTQLLPGHCSASTLAAELETNPFVQEAMEEDR